MPNLLKPFRVRNLHSGDEDLKDCSGILHLSSQDYDMEVQRESKALFTYLDEDDGETITVGSGLELEQRLSDPPGKFSIWKNQPVTDTSPTLHLFDIRRSHQNTNIWSNYIMMHNQPPSPMDSMNYNISANEHRSDEHIKVVRSCNECARQKMPCDLEECHGLSCSPCRDVGRFCTLAATTTPDITMTDENQVDSQSSTIQSHETRIESLETEIKSIKEELQKYMLRSDMNVDPLMTKLFPANQGDNSRAKSESVREGAAMKAKANAETKESTHLGMQSHYGDISQTAGKASFHPEDFWTRKIDPVDYINTYKPLPNYEGGIPFKPKQRPHRIPLSDKEGIRAAIEAEKNMTDTDDKDHAQVKAAISRRQSKIPAALDPVGYQKSNSLMDLELEAEIARFPTIFQLEEWDPLVAMGGLGNKVKESNRPLGRANTVNGPNPAARLLKPFDPAAEVIRVGAKNPQAPRRSQTTRQEPWNFTHWNSVLPTYTPDAEPSHIAPVPQADNTTHGFQWTNPDVGPRTVTQPETRHYNTPNLSNSAVSRSQSMKGPAAPSTLNPSVARSHSLLQPNLAINAQQRQSLRYGVQNRLNKLRIQHGNASVPNLSGIPDHGTRYQHVHPFTHSTETLRPFSTNHNEGTNSTETRCLCSTCLKDGPHPTMNFPPLSTNTNQQTSSSETFRPYSTNPGEATGSADTIRPFSTIPNDNVRSNEPARPISTNPREEIRLARIQKCAASLSEMGYRPQDRLSLYAQLANGDTGKAIELAEEDRKAARETQKFRRPQPSRLAPDQEHKVRECFDWLKDMGYGDSHTDRELRQISTDVLGDLSSAVARLEPPLTEFDRLLLAGRMPGSFP